MLRSGDADADFLALGSCQCRLTIFGVAVELSGRGGVSSVAFVTCMIGSSTSGARTYAISSLSALVNVSREEALAMVVSSRDAPAFGGGGGVPALIVTIAPRPIKQRTASHTVLVTSNPRMVRVCELIVSVGLNRALKWRLGHEAHDITNSFVPELTRKTAALLGRELTGPVPTHERLGAGRS
jgi:hypothetical protein